MKVFIAQVNLFSFGTFFHDCSVHSFATIFFAKDLKMR